MTSPVCKCAVPQKCVRGEYCSVSPYEKHCDFCGLPLPKEVKCCGACKNDGYVNDEKICLDYCPCHRSPNTEKIKKGAEDFANRFEGVMKELAEEEAPNTEVIKNTVNDYIAPLALENDLKNVFQKESMTEVMGKCSCLVDNKVAQALCTVHGKVDEQIGGAVRRLGSESTFDLIGKDLDDRAKSWSASVEAPNTEENDMPV